MIQDQRLLDTFVALARIPSRSGDETAVAAEVVRRLAEIGVSSEADPSGSLLCRLDGQGEPLLLTAHMDTVVPCDRVTPVVRDGVVFSDGTSVLGADNKAGVAIILELLATLRDRGLDHRPLDILFTVREETGLEGIKAFDCRALRACMGIGLDAGGEPGVVVVSAPSQIKLHAHVCGRAAHAGVNPADGINAILVAAQAISRMPLGRIDAETTANIGTITGGLATNIVPDSVVLDGEARSRDEGKLERQTQAMVSALEECAAANGASVEIDVTEMYDAYSFDETTHVVAYVMRAMQSLDVEPLLVPTGGGSDANILNGRGIETVQLGIGMREVHSTNEHIALADMVMAARIVLACVRS